MNQASAVVCAGLTKDYGYDHGVFDLDLDVGRGQTFGFIGSNGARQDDHDPVADGSRSARQRQRDGAVPGHGFDLLSTLVLLALSAALLVAAEWAFERRDIGSSLWARARQPAKPLIRVQRPALHTVWTATLVRERLSLLTWSAATAVTLGLLAWPEPSVVDVWDKLVLTQNLS